MTHAKTASNLHTTVLSSVLYPNPSKTYFALPIWEITLQQERDYPINYPRELKTWGDHILKARLDRGLFQKDVAKILGVKNETITNWEKQHTQPPWPYWKKLIDFLGYAPDRIFLIPSQCKTLGDWLRFQRRIRNLSTNDLGELIGAYSSSIEGWEWNRCRLSQYTVEKFERVFGEIPKRFQDSINTRLTYYKGDKSPRELMNDRQRKKYSWGYYIRIERKKRGISQSQLAKMMQVRKDVIQKWEHMRGVPGIPYWPEIVAFLGYVPLCLVPPIDNMPERLWFIREINGLYRHEMASVLGVSLSSIWRWEVGQQQEGMKKNQRVQEILRLGLN